MIRKTFIGTGALLFATALYGQTKTEFGGQVFQFAGTGSQEFHTFFDVAGIGSQVVTGKPFSATEERHSLQTLGDGTRIESTETNRLFRDEQGRTRLERSGGNITIYDPVAGFNAELNPSTRTANKMTVMVREGRMVGKIGIPGPAEKDAQKAKLAKLQEELAQQQRVLAESNPKLVELKAQLADLEKAFVAQNSMDQLKNLTSSYQAEYARVVTTSSEDGAKKAQAEAGQTAATVFTYSTAGSPAPAGTLSVSTSGGPIVFRAGSGDNANVESLPSQMVNGALAQGTRTTETIPVGKIGNDRAISVVNERWFSNDLQMLVKSSSSDPRFGNTTYQLTNIVQASPDPSLFQIPGDYTIRK